MKSKAYPVFIGAGGVVIACIIWFLLKKPDAVPSRESPLRFSSEPAKSTDAPPPAFLSQDAPPPAVKSAPPKRGKPPIQDTAARAALSLVGVDVTAELVWEEAINNPLLHPTERQDLIEDLNEDGLSNKKQPTAADLPLIKARLAIIDRLMPAAMDKINAEAFAEARKDLINMQARLSP